MTSKAIFLQDILIRFFFLIAKCIKEIHSVKLIDYKPVTKRIQRN